MVSNRQINLLLLCSCWIYSISGLPVSNTHQIQIRNETIMDRNVGRSFQGTGRVFPGMFSNVFGSFLPFNINVPDVFSGVFGLVNQYFASESNPRPTLSRRTKNRNLVIQPVTTTMAPEEEFDEEEEEEEQQAVEELESKKITNEDIAVMYQELLRKKDEFDKLTKKKKKKGKHKHDDMLEKIVSHLAYLELEC